MDETRLPIVVAPEALASPRATRDLLVVDLSGPEAYARAHVPGAVRLDYDALVVARGPAGGMLPDVDALGRTLSAIGVAPDRDVLAYDDQGGGRAARLVWTLHALGHARASLLDGGAQAWAAAGLAFEAGARAPAAGGWTPAPRDGAVADRAWIEARLGRPDLAIVDARSEAEYAGVQVRAARAGHIPGAVSFEWLRAMDPARAPRLRPAPALRAELEALGVTPDREVVVYCQTHHRSSHTWVVLKALGYPRVRGYPGSWSEWGNLPDTPIEA